MAEETTTSTASNTAGEATKEEETCTREELTELVRCIKFAKPDASQRAVHREISEQLSQKDGFAFLANIKLNDVKRVWKKALQQQQQQQQQQGSDGNVMKLYTVGDGTVRTLAQEYSQAAAAEAMAKEASNQEEMRNYVHLFLDVPMERSGSRPHQALINFHDNHGKGNSNKNNTNSKNSANDRGEIVKIQMAAGSEEESHPMLLYNQNRSQKTFIHPDPQDDGYERIQKWIREEGVGGALGVAGGSKAYFYSYYNKRKNIISVDVSALAPPQSW